MAIAAADTTAGRLLQFTGCEAKTIGAVLGCMCGDVLGSCVEGGSPTAIADSYPQGLRDFGSTRVARGMYTDDTQMTLALTKSLVRKGAMDAADVSQQYAEDYQPWRGYGGSARKVLMALKAGCADYRTSGTMAMPQGSFGNGGAMRIAPLGLAYRHAPADVLHQAVCDALLCTHVHPQGIDGAFIQAAAVAYLATCDGDATPHGLLSHLLGLARTDAMCGRLEKLQRLVDPNDPDNIVSTAPHGGAVNWEHDLQCEAAIRDDEVLSTIADPFQIEATEAVSCALYALARHWDHPEAAVIGSVHYGGDTDTIAAMVGALAGAKHGCSWIPARWYNALENDVDGRDAAVALALQLASLDVTH